jgi:aminoglycoside phosphotransferase (APT) family kinase protein
MVLRLDQHIAVKVTHERYAQTEYRTLSYLEEHLPTFPTPRLHGVIQMGMYRLVFTAFIPGLDLEKAWPQLGDTQKHSIRRQLDALFSQLRSLPFPPNTPLGGLDEQGCKDMRRGTRVSSEPIMDARQFEDFIFAGSKTATPLYRQLLQELMPPSAKIVFTHSDLRPANIIVRMGEDGEWTVAAIIDWDTSGFYPEYWESVKMTNNLTPRDHFDWYKFLPESLSLSKYPVQWLVDKIWDFSLDNS